MGNFIAELKRRHIYRVAAAYAVVAWVLIQLVNNIAPMLNLPGWVGAVVLVLLVVGFPIALLFAWIQKLASADNSTARAATGKLDWALMGALVLVLAAVSYQQLAPGERSEGVQQAGVEAARLAASSPASAISIAVLPFANVSGDASQEFFSDGMTDEITGALTKIADLRVVGRTSAFQFKGQNKDLRAIGQTLGATHLIDGSVRKAGNRVRIAVQLTKADDGVNVWGDTYDRELTDVFAIQEDIARAIAASLRMPLGLAPGENLVSNRTKDLGIYQDFLQGKAWLRARLTPNSGPYLKTLESVVERDPSFAPAWTLLARAYSLEPGQTDVFYRGSIEEASRFVKTTLEKGEMAARKAIELDPQSPGGYSGLAFIASNRGQWAVAEDNANKALALDPNDPEALSSAAQSFLRTGYLRRALPFHEKNHTLEPLVPSFAYSTAHAMRLNGQSEAAIALLESIPANVGRRNLFLARAYAAVGRYEDAADTVLLTRARDAEARKFLEDVAKILRAAPKPVEMPQWSPAFVGEWNFVYVPSGAFDRVMDYAEYQLAVGYPQDIGSILWQPEMAPLRKTERFKAHMRKVGLVDYWRARGWPDLCRPTAGDDFVCE